VSLSRTRYEFLDWARGVAALVMLQGHVFEAFAQGDQRQSGLFLASQFVGGMPPAVFLFLTGVTLAFLMESQERRELTWHQRLLGVLNRSRYLLVLAILFRLQLWVFAWPHSPWTDLLRVDILNCMAASILLVSPVALAGRRERIRYGLLGGLSIALAAPLISQCNLNAWPLLRDYLVPSTQGFPLFPWSAFLWFGLSVGTALKLVGSRELGRFAQWCALGGLLLILGAQKLADLPFSLYPASDFWINSPWLILIKLGVVLVLLAAAYLWTSVFSTRWSPVRQLGTSSLLVYWVHTELVYGRWLYGWRGQLSVPQIAVLALLVIAGMISLAYGVDSLRGWLRRQRESSAPWSLAPKPVEGD